MTEPPPESEERKRPTPVREGLPSEQRGGGHGEPPGAGRPAPTPVRSLDPLTPARPAESAPAESAAPPPPLPAAPPPLAPEEVGDGAPLPPAPAHEPERVTFLLGEQEWVARVEGYGQSGTGGDRGAPLMVLSFAAGGDPDRPLFETLCAARALEVLSESRLVELLAGARPFRRPGEKPEIFSDTRVRKKEL